MIETVLRRRTKQPRSRQRPLDRPAWIPAHIQHGWDTDPYAYQTEEELMAAGGLHGRILAYIMQVIDYFLQQQGFMLLQDCFMLYRDQNGIKRRTAPDLILVPYQVDPPSAPDLDTEPPPRFVAEVTSPDSHLQDLEDKVTLYLGLGISAYLVVDAVTRHKKHRQQYQLHLWRLINGMSHKIPPNADGRLDVPELDIQVWAEGQWLRFANMQTGKVLSDVPDLIATIDQETKARRQAEAENARLQAELKKLRGEL
ncbi:Uma2 family endonuclease [Anaerolineales bacterium HSG24]|nr:Uma2 family endonuclease [Anaerolineales bacterium HSG24]